MNKESQYHYLASLKKGDINSFREIYDQYYSQIYAFAQKFIPQKSMAEEATADVFIILWKKRSIIDPNKEVKAFLYKIAKDTVWNYLKKIANDKRLEQEYVEHFILLSQSIELKTGERLFLEKEQLSAIHKIIETLPPKRLEIFKLRYFEGLNNSKISQKLGISVNTVKTHLLKARLHLRERIIKAHEIDLIIFWYIIFISFYSSSQIIFIG